MATQSPPLDDPSRRNRPFFWWVPSWRPTSDDHLLRAEREVLKALRSSYQELHSQDEFVEYIERWREGIGLDKFVLLGHCFGGFLSCLYAIKHPNRVRHLILEDPWGFKAEVDREEKPLLTRATSLIAKRLNPLSPVIFAGPLGPHFMRYYRPDLMAAYSQEFMHYVYHCNAQAPTGETAFFYIQSPSATWAKSQMTVNVSPEMGFDRGIPISFIYGTKSMMDKSAVDRIRENMDNSSYVRAYEIAEMSHHVHADQPQAFNDTVNTILTIVDGNRDTAVSVVVYHDDIVESLSSHHLT